MPPKTYSDKQTQTTKQVEKNIIIATQIEAKMKDDKICEIPNYARIIRDHKRNHLEYYLELQSRRCTEHD
jgi:hypothetical protein